MPIVEADAESTKPEKTAKKAPKDGFKQAKLSFGKATAGASKPDKPTAMSDERTAAIVHAHVKLFPWKVEKSKVKEEHCAVCIIEDIAPGGKGQNASYLLEQRPNKGLLASMWQFPMLSFGNAEPPAPSERSARALSFAQAVATKHPRVPTTSAKSNLVASLALGTITHVFSHLVLHMHIYTFSTSAKADGASTPESSNSAQTIADMPRKWCTPKEVTDINMGTGHVNVWSASRKV